MRRTTPRAVPPPALRGVSDRRGYPRSVAVPWPVHAIPFYVEFRTCTEWLSGLRVSKVVNALFREYKAKLRAQGM